MLGKLIKYNWKSYWKLAAVLHASVLALSVVVRLAFVSRLDPDHTPSDATILSVILLAVLYTLIFSALSFYTTLAPAIRFYRQLYTDHGHLTWMLPIPGKTHLNAHILSGAMLQLASCCFTLLCCYVLMGGRYFHLLLNTLNEEISSSGILVTKEGLVLFAVFTVVAAFTNMILVCFCVCIGQLFPAHKVMGAVICFVGSLFLMEMIVMGISMFVGYRSALDRFQDGTDYIYDLPLQTVLLFTAGFACLMAVPEYLISRHLMTKKVNL